MRASTITYVVYEPEDGDMMKRRDFLARTAVAVMAGSMVPSVADAQEQLETQLIPDGSPGLLFLDGDHSYEEVQDDIAPRTTPKPLWGTIEGN